MATFTKRGDSWRVQVKSKGERRTATFPTKAEAAKWALEQEAEVRATPENNKVLVREGLQKLHKLYEKEGSSRSDIGRALRLQDDPIADKLLTEVTKKDLVEFRDRRLELVTPATVRRELNLFRGLFRRCREDWHTMTQNPFKEFKAPKSPPSRKRRISDKEIEAARITFGVTDDLPATTMMNRVGLLFLLGVETAMRASEMLGLEWERVHLKERFVHLPKTKNGDARDVPLTTFAVKILKALPKGDKGEPCFNLTESSRDALWRKGRDRTTLKNLHFHDSRAEGIWRLSKKLDVLQLARAIGHRDINSLLIYYDETASEMAAKLG